MRALFEALGVDFDQWKALTLAALKMDFRTSSLGRSQVQRDVRTAVSLAFQFVFYTAFGLAIALVVVFAPDLFLVGTLAMSSIMFIVGSAVLLDHNTALASPIDYAILGYRPVTSRTYFAVRLANVFAYTIALTTAAAWLPIGALFMWRGTAIGVAGTVAFYACSIATALAILLAYAWLLRLVGAGGLKRALTYAQMAMSFLVYGSYVLLSGTAARSVAASTTLPKTPWMMLFPPTWFASYLELAAGTVGPLEVLAAAASLAALGGMAAALGGRLSLEHSERLGALTAATAPAPRTEPASADRPRLFRAGEARAVALLVGRQFRNDLKFRMGVLAILPMTFVYVLMALREGSFHDPFVPPAGGGGPSPVTFVLIMFPSLLKLQLSRSDAFRASWIFFATPADRMKIVRASKDVLVAFFLAPYVVFLTAVYTYFVGHFWHVAVHLALQGLLGHLVLQVTMLVEPTLPFSKPARRSRNSMVVIAFLALMGAVSATLDIFSARVYASLAATAGVFAAVIVAGMIVDRLTRVRVALQTASLEFEG